MYRIATVCCALLWPFVNRESGAQSAAEHPYLDPEKVKSETCLQCHPDKLEGRHVHGGGGVNCESCHSSATAKKRTMVAFAGDVAGLCVRCHEIKRSKVTHAPYEAGQCLVCHNPHSSAFAGQVRASIQTLCMSCHGEGSPDVKVDQGKKVVTLLGGRTIDLASYERAQKISARHGEQSKPVAGSNPARTEPNCLACHSAHGSDVRYLLKMGSAVGETARRPLALGAQLEGGRR